MVKMYFQLSTRNCNDTLQNTQRNPKIPLIIIYNLNQTVSRDWMLTNKDFRNAIVVKIKDSGLINFWLNEFEKYTTYLRMEAVSLIFNDNDHANVHDANVHAQIRIRKRG